LIDAHFSLLPSAALSDIGQNCASSNSHARPPKPLAAACSRNTRIALPRS
jgi:hypothetical protein